MSHSPTHKVVRAVATMAIVVSALAGCSSTGSPSAEESAAPQPEAGASIAVNDEARALLPQEIQDAGVLKIGTSTDTAPFSFKPENDLIGIVPDLSSAIGSVLGVEVETTAMAFPGLVPAIQSKNIDAAWTVLNDTAEREGMLDMVSFQKTSSDFLVLEGNPKNIDSLESTCGLNVGTLRASIYVPMLEKASADCVTTGNEALNISLFDDSTKAQLQVQSGKVDAFAGLTAILRYSTSLAGGNKFALAGADLSPGYIAVATAKDTGLSDAIQAALVVIIENGAYDSVLEKYSASDDAITVDEVAVNGVTSGQLK